MDLPNSHNDGQGSALVKVSNPDTNLPVLDDKNPSIKPILDLLVQGEDFDSLNLDVLLLGSDLDRIGLAEGEINYETIKRVVINQVFQHAIEGMKFRSLQDLSAEIKFLLDIVCGKVQLMLANAIDIEKKNLKINEESITITQQIIKLLNPEVFFKFTKNGQRASRSIRNIEELNSIKNSIELQSQQLLKAIKEKILSEDESLRSFNEILTKLNQISEIDFNLFNESGQFEKDKILLVKTHLKEASRNFLSIQGILQKHYSNLDEAIILISDLYNLSADVYNLFCRSFKPQGSKKIIELFQDKLALTTVRFSLIFEEILLEKKFSKTLKQILS